MVQANRIDADWEGVKADLGRIRDTLLQRRGALVNLTADEHTLSSVRPHLDAFLGSLPAESANPTSWGQMLQPINEAITVPTQVCILFVKIFTHEDILIVLLLHTVQHAMVVLVVDRQLGMS